MRKRAGKGKKKKGSAAKEDDYWDNCDPLFHSSSPSSSIPSPPSGPSSNSDCGGDSNSSKYGGGGEWGAPPSKPTLSIHSHIEGLFSSQEHPLGGSYSSAALEHWSGCHRDKKTEIACLSRDGIFAALSELNIMQQCNVIGEPTEATAREVVKDFLFALEVNDGKFIFPDSPSLEYIGMLVALETNLLLSMERANLLQLFVMTWFVLLWRQKLWWMGYIITICIILFNNTVTFMIRGLVKEGLEETFITRRPWQPYIRWFSETFFVAALSICMTGGSKRWFIVVVTVTLASFVVDYFSVKVAMADDQSGMATIKSLLLWIQKVILLILSFSTYITFFAVAFYYFPSALILAASTAYFIVGFGIRIIHVIGHDYMLPEKWREKVDSWWSGRNGLNRGIVLFISVTVIPLWTFWWSWYWFIVWRGTVLRVLSILIAANLVSVDDLTRACELVKGWAVDVWAFLCKEWKRYWEDWTGAFEGYAADDRGRSGASSFKDYYYDATNGNEGKKEKAR